MSGVMTASLFERFLKHVDHSSECWIWKSHKNENGYGLIWNRELKKETKAHRVSWEFAYGRIPKGLCVLHKCDNPSCVRPTHLFLGTQADNVSDMMSKGRSGPMRYPERMARGIYHHKCKFTELEIRKIREAANRGTTAAYLARQYKVSHPAIRAILTGKTWSHIV